MPLQYHLWTGYTPLHCPYSKLVHLQSKKKNEYEDFHKLKNQSGLHGILLFLRAHL